MNYLRVGTDCSGIEAPIQALKLLKIPFKHVFSCEKDKYAQQSIKANYNPEILFGDIMKRKPRDIPDIDLYVCGFPCQTFSLAGRREGTDDKRGTIFWQCLKVIKTKLPQVFLLENVKGLLSIDEGRTFKKILSDLEKIGKYKVYWKVLNTRDYGIPQNRERVFIVGIRDDIDLDFQWPVKIKMKELSSIVDWDDNKKQKIPTYIKKSLKHVYKKAIFIDASFVKFSTYPNGDIYSPCLTTLSNLWCVPLRRWVNINELLAFQGFPRNFKQVVSNTQMKKQIGNSMSVNVLVEIFKNIYK